MSPTSPMSTAETSGPEAGRKRRRTTLACDECRERKRKCDGTKPLCGACSRRGISDCVWNEDRVNKGWSNSYVEGLRARVRELERLQEYTTRNAANGVVSSMVFSAAHAQEDSGSVAQPCQQVDHLVDENVQGLPDGIQMDRRSAGPESFLRSDSMPTQGVPLAPQSEPNSSTSPVEQSESDTDSEATAVDAMGVIASNIGTNGKRQRRSSDYFGPSSTMSFLHKARCAINKRCRMRGQGTESDMCKACQDETSSAPSVFSTLPTCSPGSGSDNTVFGMTVPPRAEADSLIESYWHWTHSLYPLVHRPSFERIYHTIWYPRTEPQDYVPGTSLSRSGGIYGTVSDRLFYCMLNALFALGALFNPRIEQKNRDHISRSFFDRAKKLLDLDLLAAGNLPLVQTLLVMGQYLQSTGLSSSCWNVIGLAVRVAQCIGLHHDPMACDQGCCPFQALDQVETEMRRRAWAGCVTLDRVLSLTSGRPLMVHSAMAQSQFILPSSIDDQYLTQLPESPGSQPEKLPSLTECFIQTVQLQNILGKVLTSMFDGGPGSVQDNSGPVKIGAEYMTSSTARAHGTSTAAFQRILFVDSELLNWHNKLPLHLRIGTYQNCATSLPFANSGRVELFRRQATALELRFLHVRVTMLQPLLSVLCDPVNQLNAVDPKAGSPLSNMQHGMLLEAANACVSEAQQILKIIEQNLHSTVDRLPPPWYIVFYIHSSAIVLLTSVLNSPKDINLKDDSSFIWFNRCLAALQAYESRSRSARRCRKHLLSVKQEFFNHRNRNCYPLASLVNLPSTDIPVDTTHAKFAESAGTRTTTARENNEGGIMGSGNAELEFSARNHEFFLSQFVHDDLRIDPYLWMRNSPDMTQLELGPFVQADMETIVD